ncbi:MAG: hypothetical protein ACPLTP_01620 [Thermotoga caldifontis]|uniref:hypothetical protein n=1 Tax=Thermotoga caldifontis TaxID=1508419 RepID=UPI003C7E3CB4
MEIQNLCVESRLHRGSGLQTGRKKVGIAVLHVLQLMKLIDTYLASMLPNLVTPFGIFPM